MKLELKHLAPYLPYCLKGKDHNGEMIDVSITLCSHWVSGRIGITPILRPLSDLTKEIEHISYTKKLEPLLSKIVPEDLLKKHWHTNIRNDGHFSRNNGDGTATGFQYQSCPYDILLLLFEWHFDVFGLIENDLAIDINTLESNK